MRDKTIITQYQRDGSNLCDIIERIRLGLSVDNDIQAFYDNFFNINTAKGYWLDVWGVIVGVDRYLQVQSETSNFGFEEAADLPFNDGVFYNGVATTDTFALSDDIFRRLLIAKAMANIAACDAFSLNSILTYFFAGRGKCYVTQPANMIMNYVFEFYLEAWEKALFTQHKIFPRPAGVLVNALELPGELWGFNEAFDYQPFNDGIFYSG
jgi:hypothetical protein